MTTQEMRKRAKGLPLHDKAREALLEAAGAIDELNALIAIQHTRLMWAEALWQYETHSQHKPDPGTLVEWLIKRPCGYCGRINEEGDRGQEA